MLLSQSRELFPDLVHRFPVKPRSLNAWSGPQAASVQMGMYSPHDWTATTSL